MIIGHKKIINNLKKSLDKDGVSQAYLFYGPEGVGKYLVALYFSKIILGEKLQPFEKKMNPDLIIIKPEIEEIKGITRKKEIKIEKIRELQHQLMLTSFGKRFRIAIIDEADKLNRSSQNAFLKTLEEPRENLVIILVTSNPQKLLPTIISRCQKVRFNLVSKEEMASQINEVNESKDELIFWSLGRPGFMKILSENKEELDYRRECVKELNGLLNQNISDKFKLAEAMSKDTTQAIKKLDLWLVLARESLIGKKGLAKINAEKSFEIIELISKANRLLKDTNSNARFVLENLFLRF